MVQDSSSRAQTTTVDRRTVLRSAGAGLTAVGLGGLAGCTGGGSGGLTFGAPYINSGAAAIYGEEAKRGYELAQSEINGNDGIDGQEISVQFRDTSEDALRQVRSLVEEESVDALFGLDSSSTALQIAPQMPDLERPLVVTHAASPFVTAPEGSHERAVGNQWVFRDDAGVSQDMYAAAQVAADSGATEWTTLGPDYAFGTDMWAYFKAFSRGLDAGLELNDDAAEFPELGESDYTPFISNILDADPDGLMTSLWGGDLQTFISQAQDQGLFEQLDVTMLATGLATELNADGSPLPEGTWASTRYDFLTPDTAANQAFREAYVEEYDRYPTYNAEGAYRALYVYKKAIESAGSTDPEAVIDALSGMDHSGPVGSYRFAEETNQATVPGIWGKASYSEEWESKILTDVRRTPTDPQNLRDALADSDLPAGV